jgi:hypothetical protein
MYAGAAGPAVAGVITCSWVKAGDPKVKTLRQTPNPMWHMLCVVYAGADGSAAAGVVTSSWEQAGKALQQLTYYLDTNPCIMRCVLCTQVQLALQQLESSRAQVARLEADLKDYKARAQVRILKHAGST